MEKQKIIIIGAGGQSKNTSLVIEDTKKFEIIGLVDDDISKKGQKIRGYPILGSIDQICQEYDNVSFAFSIGNSSTVENISKKIKEFAKNNNKKFLFPNIIHPTVQIRENEVKMGEGNIIFPNVLLFAEIEIGNFNFFNRCCSISHETKVGDYCFVHSGVHLSGQIILENKVWVGVGSTIIQRKKIHENATVGAGAVVTKDVEKNAIVVGNPAKILRYKE